MKKKLSVLLALLLIFSNALQAFATEPLMTESPMNDTEYEAQVAEILASYNEDPEAAIQALEELDTELLSAPTIVEHGNDSYTRATYPSNYDLSVSSFKRSNSNRIYLQWILTANVVETSPGPLDYVGLEWDTEYASYYSSTAGGTGCTLQGRDAGIVLFNVEDVNMSAGSYVYGTVQVTPIATGWMSYGSKFVHTYDKPSLSGSATFNFTPSASTEGSLGFLHTMSFTVNVDSNAVQWPLWADNDVNILEI